ncbi:MAG: DUF3141 domain-containing protein [Betaproteobacteria bacterium]|nr:MAG: DUF3141 domain-containing protein [Betaproteobacteria bacterium]
MTKAATKNHRAPKGLPAPASAGQQAIPVSTVVSRAADPTSSASMWATPWAYPIDFWQRTVLFLDTLRERADNMLEHEQAGLPPLLDFDYELLLDARHFERPANYALLRITGTGTDADCYAHCADDTKRPLIIVDPRAGHGPGIGGFKRDSEVGMALHEGHAVYFVMFYPEPCLGQTLADVLHALRRFVEEVSRRHEGRTPVLYGNCQAGWAMALLSAGCGGLAGPAVLNGSPLSYWAGAPDVNPMRLAGGLVGGVWMTHFLADLSNGSFDGAWLVQNFEALNPAHAMWDKLYGVFANIDDERERFLDFERWWSGFYFLSREEIVAIVENLFVGNKLERGEMRVCDDCMIDLKRIRNPLLIFASSGDNITPPHQALNWIPAIYPTTAALKAAGQRIVFLINPHVGHLGIFASASVARLEHRAILESVHELEGLSPGLYEMKIINPTGDPDCRKPQYEVVFEERQVEDLHFDSPPETFEAVRQLSEFNESLYRCFVSPVVQTFATPWTALTLKWLHPMRTSRYLFSARFSPWMHLVEAMSPMVREHRQPVNADNPALVGEQAVSRMISNGLEGLRKWRDETQEAMFWALFDRQGH